MRSNMSFSLFLILTFFTGYPLPNDEVTSSSSPTRKNGTATNATLIDGA